MYLMKTKHICLFLFAFILTTSSLQAHTVPPLPPVLTAGIFLYYPGATIGKGSVNNDHPDEVEILAFSSGFSKGKEPLSFQDYAVTKLQDGSTNALQSLLISGAPTNGVEIRIYKQQSKGGVILVSKIQLREAIVTSYATGGSTGELTSGCETCPGLSENISFSFAGIKIDNFSYNFK